MKKQLYFLFLLLLSVKLAIAQTARYEYWLDNDYDNRTVVADDVDAVSLDMDISSMMPGLHYFSFRTQDKSGQWGGLSRYLFFIRENADANAAFMTKYEYWLDNNCDERTVVNGETTDVLLDLDISQLSPGLHFFNIRAQGKSGQWGGLSRYLFFMRAEADATVSSMSKYEYWLDNNYGERTIVDGSAEDVPLNLDISHLNPGLHYFNVRAQGKNGQWGGLSRYLFFVKQGNLGNLANIEYWIDNRQEVTTQQVTDSTVVITMDISNLVGGKHTFYMEGVTSKGARCLLNGYEFNVEFAPEPEPYAVLSENNTVLTFYYDEKKDERNGMSVGPFSWEDGYQDWYNQREIITKVEFDSSFVDCTTLTSTAYWFYECRNLTTIIGINYLKTDNVTNMNCMFYNCSSLTSLDVTGFNTANVENYGMLFVGCSSLTSLDVTGFNTAKAWSLNAMFDHCSGLKILDLSNFKTDGVNDITNMFYECTGLTTIYVGSEWSTTNINNSNSVFANCISLVGGAGTVYDANHVDYTYAHIDGGTDNPGYFTDKNAEEIPDTVKTPTFSFESYNNIRIETETEDAETYYTMTERMLSREETDFSDGYLSGSSGWNAWGDNMKSGYVGYGGRNDSRCLNLISKTDSIFESAQAGYKFSEALEKNNYYMLTFKARSESGQGQLQIYCQNDTLENTRSAADTLTIGKELADYEVMVKIENDKTNQFVLNFGAVADTYYVDNVQFGRVISDTVNNLRTRYEYPIEARQGINIKAVAVKQGMIDSAPAYYDYFYDGWNMLRDIYDWGWKICDDAYGDPNVPLQQVDEARKMADDMFMYILDRRNGGEHIDDSELMDFISYMDKTFYEIELMKRGFTIDGVCYHAIDSTQVEVIASLDYYTPYRNAITVAKEVHYNDLDFQVTGVAQGAFTNSALAAIVWNPTVALKYDDVAVINNPNLLVYVNDASLAPENITNIVVNKVAKNIELVDASNNNFYCPEPFTAEAISYTREFSQETMVGISRGWEAIALPFDVQTILHEKQGVISPFGRNDNNKHFWLRRLGANGFVQADMIDANVPYIIAMPNSSEYSEQYNLPGRVTFSSANVTVPVTETRTLALADSTIVMASTTQRLSRSSRYYALNVGEVRGQYLEGSVFERDYREIRPFEAYTIHRGDTPAPRFVPINEINGGTTGIEDVRSLMSDDSGENWYDLNGRKLLQKPIKKGVYLNNGHKVVIR